MSTTESSIDGSYLLPIERMTPDNIAALRTYAGEVTDIQNYMDAARSALVDFQGGYTTKIVLNPSDVQTYISRIREVTIRIGGGYDTDGTTLVEPLAASILPDLLMSLRDSQLWLCRLYAAYLDSQGTFVGPVDDVEIEDTADGGDVV